jgi:hypothetical protein
MHGGTSLAGPAHPSWIDGRHSRVLPKRLLDDYQASRRDPDRLALDNELAIVDARLNDVLARTDSGEAGALWSLLRASWKAVEAARRANDPAALDAALWDHGETIARGQADWLAWSAALDLVERRRRVVDSERKRLVAAQRMISAEQALAMMALLVDVIERHVTDPQALQAVVTEFARLTGGPPQC